MRMRGLLTKGDNKMIGDCTRSLLRDIETTQNNIKNFSKRAEGISDDLVLFMAETLVEQIKDMIEQKQIVKDNIKEQ